MGDTYQIEGGRFFVLSSHVSYPHSIDQFVYMGYVGNICIRIYIYIYVSVNLSNQAICKLYENFRQFVKFMFQSINLFSYA